MSGGRLAREGGVDEKMKSLMKASEALAEAFEAGDARAAAAAFGKGARAAWILGGGAPQLTEAARRGEAGLVAVALAAGADPNARHPKTGRTALGECVAGGHVELAEVLLEAGADIGRGGSFGQSALHICCEKGPHRPRSPRDAQMARTLAAAGADVEARNRLGHTALAQACAAWHWEMVKPLLELGASVAARSDEGDTPLTICLAAGEHCVAGTQSLAAWRGAVLELLSHGADPSAQDKRGVSGIDRARRLRAWVDAELWVALEGAVLAGASASGRSAGPTRAL